MSLSSRGRITGSLPLTVRAWINLHGLGDDFVCVIDRGMAAIECGEDYKEICNFQ